MGATVYTTGGGRRFHFDHDCMALDAGRALHPFQEPWGGCSVIRTRSNLGAALVGYTACRVCVPPAHALPATGEDFGHEPVDEYAATPEGARGVSRIVCARCTRWQSLRVLGLSIGRRVAWPCTSAAVLGLVVVDADRWNRRYPVGTAVAAYPQTREDEPLLTRTRTPAWRLGTGDSLVSVDGYAGGIALTHVDPRDGAR